MDIDFIADAIGKIGFPVLVCLGLFWYVLRLTKQHKEMENKIAEALATLRTEINNTMGAKIDTVCGKIDTVERVTTATISMVQENINAKKGENNGTVYHT